MENYKTNFIKLCYQVEALCFGEFTLKSGRISPYFFNAGLFCDGYTLKGLADAYVEKLLESEIEFDLVFGPAYKGIPLASAIAMRYSERTNKPMPFAFNRKEEKEHGEGGITVGAPIEGKILVVDDVMTAGTAITETINLFKQFKQAKIEHILVALDRQETTPDDDISAMQKIKIKFNIDTHSVITLADLIHYVEKDLNYQKHLNPMKLYQKQYGIKL